MKLDNQEIKKILQEKKVVLGREQCFKLLKRGKLESVLVTSNCSDQTKTLLHRYAGLQKIETFPVSLTNQELGTLCRKPFPVSLLGILKS